MPNLHQVRSLFSFFLILYKLLYFYQVLFQSKNSSQSLKGDAPIKKNKKSTSKKQGNTSATDGKSSFSL